MEWRPLPERKFLPWTNLPIPVLQRMEQEHLWLRSVSHCLTMAGTWPLRLWSFSFHLDQFSLHLLVDLQFWFCLWFCLDHSFFSSLHAACSSFRSQLNYHLFRDLPKPSIQYRSPQLSSPGPLQYIILLCLRLRTHHSQNSSGLSISSPVYWLSCEFLEVRGLLFPWAHSLKYSRCP